MLEKIASIGLWIFFTVALGLMLLVLNGNLVWAGATHARLLHRGIQISGSILGIKAARKLASDDHNEHHVRRECHNMIFKYPSYGLGHGIYVPSRTQFVQTCAFICAED